MAAGVLDGSTTPCHDVISKPGSVSATVGNSGSSASRFAPVGTTGS